MRTATSDYEIDDDPFKASFKIGCRNSLFLTVQYKCEVP